MIELKYNYIGARCPVCNKNSVHAVNRFQFASGTILSCPDCGTSLVNIKKSVTSNVNLACFACGTTHDYSISQKNFFSGKPFSFCCKENDVDVLYAGNYEDVENALFQLDREIKQLTENYYSNIEQTYGVYTKSALTILEEKARSNRILCLCGNYEIQLKLSKDGIEVICPDCGGSEYIPVSCEEDLVSLMERRSILIK